MNVFHLLLVGLITITAEVGGEGDFVCEGTTGVKIQCSNINKLTFTKALYTRVNEGPYCTTCCKWGIPTTKGCDIASGCLTTDVYSNCGNAIDFSSQLTAHCKNREYTNACKFDVTNDYFLNHLDRSRGAIVDPCFGVYKYFAYEYTCTPKFT